ncbi:MAG TPA: choice-of-anchor E domain-containing protein [Phycisphaerae bacterium]|nr:choice-of-anchor E domain-containing protein [Phycisphaerae bacterium]
MRSQFSSAIGMAVILSLTLVSSPAELRAGGGCKAVASYTVMQTAVPTQLVQIPQFNPATGQLCFALVRVTASYDALIKVENMAATGSFITVSATETVNVDVPGFFTPVLGDILNADETIPPTTKNVTAWDNGPAFSFVGTDTEMFSFLPENPRIVPLASVGFNAMDPGFPSFTGVGNLPDGFNVTGESDFTVNSNAGDYNAQATLRMSVLIEVEYHYVPEPATISLIAGSLLMVRRSRRRR